MNDLNDLSTLPFLQESVIQWQCSDVKLYSYSNLFFTDSNFWFAPHVSNSFWGWLYIWYNLVTLRAVATQVSSSFHSSFASSAFMTPIPGRVQRCSSRTLWCIYNQCNYIPATPSPEYLSGYLPRVFHNLVTSYVRVMLSNAHVAQFDLEEQMRHCLWGPDTESVCSPSPPTGWRAESLHRAADARLR